MRIAHISDTHIGVPPPARSDREADLARAVAALCELRPRPDVVIHTGDAANSGRPAEYDRLRALLAPLPMPWFVVPGNRDRRRHMRAVLGAPGVAVAEPAAPLDFAVDVGPLRVIGFDTTSRSTNMGAAGRERIAALDAMLRAAAGRPVVLAVHHPPFVIAGARDPRHFADWDEALALDAMLARHRHLRLVLAGHVHRFAAGRVGGAPAFTVPSLAHDLRKGTGAPAAARGPAWAIHDLDAGMHHRAHELCLLPPPRPSGGRRSHPHVAEGRAPAGRGNHASVASPSSASR